MTCVKENRERELAVFVSRYLLTCLEVSRSLRQLYPSTDENINVEIMEAKSARSCRIMVHREMG